MVTRLGLGILVSLAELAPSCDCIGGWVVLGISRVPGPGPKGHCMEAVGALDTVWKQWELDCIWLGC